jgi:hypothetical protein
MVLCIIQGVQVYRSKKNTTFFQASDSIRPRNVQFKTVSVHAMTEYELLEV